VIVIGLGNEFRHDDAIGLIAARRLRERGVAAEEHQGDVVALVERWKGAVAAILIDAVTSGAAPGTVYRIDVSTLPLNREQFKGSTHALGLADTIELSRALSTLPARMLVFGVEVRDLRPGVGLSSEVESALPDLMEQVLSCTKLPPHTWRSCETERKAY
jgi:hydrogenase maturation protease